jgi:outer membrane lipoprotein-sorting protein
MHKWILALCLLMAGTSMAQSGFTAVKDAEPLKAKISAVNGNVKTIQSNFTQEKYLSVMSEKIQSKGLFLFKRENTVRWEYTDPFKYIIVLSGNKVQIRDEEKKSEYDMASNKSFRQINDMMVQLVQGTVFNSKQYQIKFMESSNAYMVELLPIDKKMKDYFKTIQLYFDKTSYDVSQIKMIEANGDYTSIRFSNRKINVSIADDKFILH